MSSWFTGDRRSNRQWNGTEAQNASDSLRGSFLAAQVEGNWTHDADKTSVGQSHQQRDAHQNVKVRHPYHAHGHKPDDEQRKLKNAQSIENQAESRRRLRGPGRIAKRIYIFTVKG